MEWSEGWSLAGSKRAGWGARARRAAARRLPVLAWLPRYSRTAALADAVAGLTLGLTLVPQSIAYAALANLPVQYGLYSSFVGTMLYVVLGTVKEVSIGPTSLMALLTLQVCHGLPVQFVVLLTFLSGCVVFAMGLLRLGFLVDLISPAVTSGFTSATAVIIVCAQLKGLLGISFLAESMLDNLLLLWRLRHRARLHDALLAAACCTTLLLLRKLKDVKISSKRRVLRKAVWLVSIARNAIVVAAAAGLAYTTRPGDHADSHLQHPYFKLSGRVEPGLPPLGAPPFGMESANGTVSFVDMARRLSSGVLLLPLFMVLANIAIAKAFSGDARVDATQEMLTLGLCNMAGSLVHAMPTCGAFTRSAVSHASGVRTPMAGLYSGLITLMALAFMTEYFYFIPKACLSSVLICAVIFMVDHSTAARLWRVSRGELAVLCVTFAVCALVSVELGLLAGVLAALARLLRQVMRPRLPPPQVHKSWCGEVVVCGLPGSLVYLNAEHVCARLARLAARAGQRALLLDCTQLTQVDYSALQVLESRLKKISASGQRVIMYNASGAVSRQLERLPVPPAALTAPTPPAALAAAFPPPPAALPPPPARPAPRDPHPAPERVELLAADDRLDTKDD